MTSSKSERAFEQRLRKGVMTVTQAKAELGDYEAFQTRRTTVLKEAIEFCQEKATQWLTPEIIEIPGEPKHVRWKREGGVMQRIELAPPHRILSLTRLDDLIQLAQGHFDATVSADRRMAVFFNHESIRLIFDTGTGYEWASVRLVPSKEYRFFRSRQTEPLISVEALRLALRVDLSKCFTNKELIDQVSKIEAYTKGDSSVEYGRGKESLGKSIHEAVASESNLPNEHQAFQVRCWANTDLDFRLTLDCVLDPNIKTLQWFLKPLEASYDDLIQSSLNVVESRLLEGLKDTGIPIYQGSWDNR